MLPLLITQTRFYLLKEQQAVEFVSFRLQAFWSTTWNSKYKSYFNFFSNNRNNQKLLSVTRNKKKKHDKILMLAKSKLKSIETLVSQALVDMEISHEEFNVIIREDKNIRG